MNYLDAHDKLIQTRPHVRNTIATRKRPFVMWKGKSTIQIPDVEMSHAGEICFSKLFWFICQTIALAPHQYVKTFLPQAGKIVFHFLLEHFKCTLPAPGKYSPYLMYTVATSPLALRCQDGLLCDAIFEASYPGLFVRT